MKVHAYARDMYLNRKCVKYMYVETHIFYFWKTKTVIFFLIVYHSELFFSMVFITRSCEGHR